MSDSIKRTQLKETVGGSLISVIYNPNLSLELKIAIANNVTPSMTSHDGESSQYSVDAVKNAIDNADIHPEKVADNDFDVLDAMSALGYHFIEI